MFIFLYYNKFKKLVVWKNFLKLFFSAAYKGRVRRARDIQRQRDRRGDKGWAWGLQTLLLSPLSTLRRQLGRLSWLPGEEEVALAATAVTLAADSPDVVSADTATAGVAGVEGRGGEELGKEACSIPRQHQRANDQ